MAFQKAPIGLKACCRIEFLRRLIECPDIQCHPIKTPMFCLRFAKAQQRCPNPAPAIPLVHTELFNVVKVLCAHISRFRLVDILHHGKTARFIFHACHNHIGTRRLERLINAVLQFLAKTDAKNIRPSFCMQPTHHHPKLIYARQLRQFRISYRHSLRFLFFQPMIQKLHLFLGMEPMLASGQIRILHPAVTSCDSCL